MQAALKITEKDYFIHLQVDTQVSTFLFFSFLHDLRSDKAREIVEVGQSWQEANLNVVESECSSHIIA